jgi:hypothetical protein
MQMPTIHWPYLLLALLMLWFPRHWMRVGPRLLKVRRRGRDPVQRFSAGPQVLPDDKTVVLKLELLNRRNYVDFFRALGGAFALMQHAVEPGRTTAPAPGFWLQVAVMAVGVIVQFVRVDQGVKMFAPLFYLFGAAIAVIGPYAGLFAMLAVCAMHVMLPNPRYFLACYGLLIAVLHHVLEQGDVRWTVVFVLLAWTPALTSLLANRPLITYSHKRKM